MVYSFAIEKRFFFLLIFLLFGSSFFMFWKRLTFILCRWILLLLQHYWYKLTTCLNNGDINLLQPWIKECETQQAQWFHNQTVIWTRFSKYRDLPVSLISVDFPCLQRRQTGKLRCIPPPSSNNWLSSVCLGFVV